MNMTLIHNPNLCRALVRLKAGNAADNDFRLFVDELTKLAVKRDREAIDGDGDRVRGKAQGIREVLDLIVEAENSEERLAANARETGGEQPE